MPTSSNVKRGVGALLAFTAAIVWLVAWPAAAGVIVPASAAGTLTLTDGTTSQTTPLAFPSANAFSFTSPAGGAIAGGYVFQSAPEDVLSTNVTAYSGATGATTHLTLGFVTSQDALYTLVASFDGSNIFGFSGRLDGVLAYAATDFNQGRVGNIPALQPLTLTGFLPAGTHTFSLDYGQGPMPHAPFLSSGQGSLSVTLAPAPVVPLPPSVWGGLVVGAMLLTGWIGGKEA